MQAQNLNIVLFHHLVNDSHQNLSDTAVSVGACHSKAAQIRLVIRKNLDSYRPDRLIIDAHNKNILCFYIVSYILICLGQSLDVIIKTRVFTIL